MAMTPSTIICPLETYLWPINWLHVHLSTPFFKQKARLQSVPLWIHSVHCSILVDRRFWPSCLSASVTDCQQGSWSCWLYHACSTARRLFSVPLSSFSILSMITCFTLSSWPRLFQSDMFISACVTSIGSVISWHAFLSTVTECK